MRSDRSLLSLEQIPDPIRGAAVRLQGLHLFRAALLVGPSGG